MIEIQNLIITRLKSDTNLVTLHFMDVINRWPQEGGPGVRGATPTVYDPASGKLYQNIVVLDGGDYDSPDGQGYGGKVSGPTVVGIVHATDAGKNSLIVLDSRLKTHFGKKFIEIKPRLNRQFRVENQQNVEQGSEVGYNGMLVSRWTLEVVGYEPLLVL